MTGNDDLCNVSGIYSYLNGILNNKAICKLCGGALENWLQENAALLEIDVSGFSNGDDAPRRRRRGNIPATNGTCGNLELAARQIQQQCREYRLPSERMSAMAAELFGLDEISCKLLGLFAELLRNSLLDGLLDILWDATQAGRHSHNSLSVRRSAVYAVCTGCRAKEVETALSEKSKLVRCGVLEIESDGDINIYQPLAAIVKSGEIPADSVTFRNKLLGSGLQAALPWGDFAHIKGADLLERLLKGARESAAQGINILLYGPPGTGKTEFAKTLAQNCGIRLYAAGETDDDGGEPTRGERRSQLRVMQALLAVLPGNCILFDEAEDLFGGSLSLAALFGMRSRRSDYSKVYMNRMLETNKVPVIWTTNDIESFDPALLRRMTMVISFPELSGALRGQFVVNECERQGLLADKKTLRELASEYPAAPAVIAGAIRTAQLANAGLDGVRATLDGMSEALGFKVQRCQRDSFEPQLVNATLPLIGIAERICESKRLDFSMCLSGAPGTGKSAYARYLAEQLGLEVMHVRASDLLSMYVGGSEKNIARAFRQARDQKRLLIFDEADSLLRDRSKATQSWEVTQVNEMLTWMESHEYPFVCTTNLMNDLDSASLRRFTFKVCFNYLDNAQKALAFERFFSLPAPAGLNAVENLTPGDFAVVQKINSYAANADASALLELLRQETAHKQPQRAKVGF